MSGAANSKQQTARLNSMDQAASSNSMDQVTTNLEDITFKQNGKVSSSNNEASGDGLNIVSTTQNNNNTTTAVHVHDNNSGAQADDPNTNATSKNNYAVSNLNSKSCTTNQNKAFSNTTTTTTTTTTTNRNNTNNHMSPAPSSFPSSSLSAPMVTVPPATASSSDKPWTLGTTSTPSQSLSSTNNIQALSQSLHSNSASAAALGEPSLSATGSASFTHTSVTTGTGRPVTASSLSSAAAFNASQKIEIGMRIRETPSPLYTPSYPKDDAIQSQLHQIPLLDSNVHVVNVHVCNNNDNNNANVNASANASNNKNNNAYHNHCSNASNPNFHIKSKYEDRLSNLGLEHPSEPVESVLASACASLGFDIVEMWLRTGPKLHQLIHSHLRHSALDDTTRTKLVDLYYGDNAPNRVHKLSPALCKKARVNNDIVWVTSQTVHGAQALRCSLSGVNSAVAVPVCHEESQTNLTIIYFSMKPTLSKPAPCEFLKHMSLAAAIVSVNIFDHDLIKKQQQLRQQQQQLEEQLQEEQNEFEYVGSGNDGGDSDINNNEPTSYPSQGFERAQTKKFSNVATPSTDIEYEQDHDRQGQSIQRIESFKSLYSERSVGEASRGAASYAAMEQQYNSMNVRTQLSKKISSSASPFSTSIAQQQQQRRPSVQSVVTLPADYHMAGGAGAGAKLRSHSMISHDQYAMSTSELQVTDHDSDPSSSITPNAMTAQSEMMEECYSITGADLNMNWVDLKNLEYLTDGGNNWIHTAILNKQLVVVKQLKPEVTDNINCMDEIETELNIHKHLDHRNIVSLLGSGYDRHGRRFIILERLDGGTLGQLLGYDTRIRDRRRRFFQKKNKLPYAKVLKYAQQIAAALDYLHRNAIEGSMIIHRDLKPDNIGFMLDGTLKVMDFGLSTIVPDASPESDEVYELSGETGSLRYMAPEVAKREPYNHKADVYSFGIMLWELVAFTKPYDRMNRDDFMEKVVYGGLRPEIGKKIPNDLSNLMQTCWDIDPDIRPTFQTIYLALAEMLGKEVSKQEMNQKRSRVGKFVKKKTENRNSAWF